MRRTLAFAHPSFAFVAGLALAAPVYAQESTTRGFNVGLHISGQSIRFEDDEGEGSNAGGGGLVVGYGLNRTVQLFMQIDGGEFDVDTAQVEGKWTMGHVDLGTRFHFANSLRRWVPYLEAALSYRAVSVEDGRVNEQAQSETVTMSGGAITLGGGIMFYFNESWAADLQLAWSGGRFTDLKAGNVTFNNLEVDAQSGRFDLGVSWWP